MIGEEMPVLNLAGYKFIDLEDLTSERSSVCAQAKERGLKGTVLLSPEGLNTFFAGPEEAARSFSYWLQQRYGQMDFRESWSEVAPFKRMLVRLKKEVITMKWSIKEAQKEADYVEPEELKAWLDGGDDLVLLDTRKDFEYELGSFENSKKLSMTHFTEFPKLAEELPANWREKKIVTFCTGGVRCEKAAPYLALKGYDQVYQLKGGILGYFEKCGGAHWRGKCFVFDHRVLVESDLSVAKELICRVCGSSYDRPQSEMLELGLYMACRDCIQKESA